eukprot:GHUV01041162.1.p1 GENE.GHUV01041162.1~~GHUV01041162.1.p1  ORF type:complete len:331 (+),score=99.01 GHUV01041162.1:819-1811(+)
MLQDPVHRAHTGLLVFVSYRTAHQNVGQLQDLYLPTNTLAALANLAPQVSRNSISQTAVVAAQATVSAPLLQCIHTASVLSRDRSAQLHVQLRNCSRCCLQATSLHSHAAQRLVGLTVQLARRWLKLSQAARDPLAPPLQELQVPQEFLRILLEVINCILSLNLTRNPELVYALLHKQEAFGQLRGQQGLAEPAENLQVVIDYFNSRLDSLNSQPGAAPEGHSEWSVDRVLEMVQTFTQTWRGDRLKQLPEMRFVYEEEAAPEEFFVPYCWSLAVAATSSRLMIWNLSAVALLTQLSGVEVVGDGMEGQLSAGLSHQWSSEDGTLHDSQV